MKDFCLRYMSLTSRRVSVKEHEIAEKRNGQETFAMSRSTWNR